MREDKIRDILSTVNLPPSEKEAGVFSLEKHLISLGIQDNTIQVVLEAPPQDLVYFQKIKELYEQILKNAYPQARILCAVTSQKASGDKTSAGQSSKGPMETKIQLPGVRHVIAVASGKGGVGKSCVAVNLAIALSQLGQKVGLLDADIYGPSLPKMLGLTEKPGVTEEKKLIPLTQYGIKCLSIGLMIPPEKAVIWRGPMVQSAFQQLLKDSHWGELDFLILDMPPGTGDVQLTLAQRVHLTGSIIVSTPQDIALIDARKGINMFRQVDVPILGIVENMSVFHCPQCDHPTHIFSQGGALATALEMDIPVLGEIPLHLGLREGADKGVPFNYEHPHHEIAQIYREMAEKIKQQVS